MPIPDYQSLLLPFLQHFSDGKELTEYMVDFGIGVSILAKYEVMSIDSDYFLEE